MTLEVKGLVKSMKYNQPWTGAKFTFLWVADTVFDGVKLKHRSRSGFSRRKEKPVVMVVRRDFPVAVARWILYEMPGVRGSSRSAQTTKKKAAEKKRPKKSASKKDAKKKTEKVIFRRTDRVDCVMFFDGVAEDGF